MGALILRYPPARECRRVLLVLKVFLVPALVVSVTLGARRWGPRVGGFLTSFPIVAGPTLFFFALEQGHPFVREAARATLLALVAVSVSGLVYAWASLRAPWWTSLLASWASFVVTTLALNSHAWPLPLALVGAVGSFFLVRALLPAVRGAPVVAPRSAWDLPLRTLVAITAVLTLTGLAEWLGPRVSGAFTAFPSALGILLVFTHVQQGSASVIRFLHGFLPGMWSFALFVFVLAVAIVPLGTWIAFALAIASLGPPQAVVLWHMTRPGASPPFRRSSRA
ncbi:MAG: hypothetical protein ACREF4_20070 [Gammaproteobacteria bacterium]